MKIDTKKIEKEVVAYFRKKSKYKKLQVTAHFYNNICSINISSGASLGDLVSFDNLEWLSKKLKTKKIKLESENYSSGCDSCDYGATYSINLVCREIKI